MPTPIFDFHIHPSFKTFLGVTLQKNRHSCWENISFPLNNCVKILNSQSSLSQMQTGNVRLAVANLLSLERPLAESLLLKIFNNLTEKLDDNLFEKVRNQTEDPANSLSYFTLFLAERGHLVQSAVQGSATQKVKIINSMAEWQDDGETLHLLLAAEGGHNFYGEVDKGEQEDDPNAVLGHLGFFKQKTEKHRLLYITLLHLYRHFFGNHAFAIKLINGATFKPVGNGLTPLGKAFVREALRSSATEHRILIDIKHMSLQSRLDYYQLRRTEFPDVPIIATHMGVTGCSYRHNQLSFLGKKNQTAFLEAFFNFDRCKGLRNTYFNPWSINLYLEDISEIIASRGLIGVSLDKRILGCQSVIETEFLSAAETVLSNGKPVFSGVDLTEKKDNHLSNNALTDASDNELHYLANNLLYLAKVGQEILVTQPDGTEQPMGIAVWNHFCIGSDFDGLIAPIEGFADISQLPSLRGKLHEALTLLAEESIVPIPIPDNVEDLILFDNAFRFLQEHFQ